MDENNNSQIEVRDDITKELKKDKHRLSPHFHKKEFNQKQEQLDLEKVVVNPVLVENLEKLRELIGNKPIRVNSGYRTKEYNKRVGGVKNSQHLVGNAADIESEGMTSQELEKHAKDVGFTFTQTYKDKPHLHVDVR